MTAATLDLTTATPAEIDAVLFPLWAARWAANDTIHHERQHLAAHLFPGSVRAWDQRRGEVRALVSKYGDGTDTFARCNEPTSYANKCAQRIAHAEAELAAACAAIAPIDVEYDRRGRWTRYVLVDGGHLHKQGCGTLRPTTAAYLLAESSGLTDAEVVASYSYTACTRCFPDAPVAAVPDDGRCPGSGRGVRDVNGSLRMYRKWGACQECGQRVAATSLNNARKHAAATEVDQ